MIPIIILAIENEDDRVFMESLYFNYNRLIRCEISKVIKGAFDVEDVEQTVLEKLIDKLDLLRTMDRDRLVNYIIVSSRNNAYNYIRGNKKVTLFSYDEAIDDFFTISRTPIQMWEDSNHIKESWEKLDVRSRYVLELKYVLDKTDKEIAFDLGVQPSSVRMIVSRARQKLNKIVKEAEVS